VCVCLCVCVCVCVCVCATPSSRGSRGRVELVNLSSAAVDPAAVFSSRARTGGGCDGGCDGGVAKGGGGGGCGVGGGGGRALRQLGGAPRSALPVPAVPRVSLAAFRRAGASSKREALQVHKLLGQVRAHGRLLVRIGAGRYRTGRSSRIMYPYHPISNSTSVPPLLSTPGARSLVMMVICCRARVGTCGCSAVCGTVTLFNPGTGLKIKISKFLHACEQHDQSIFTTCLYDKSCLG
jgi:hypothetical protein